VQCRGIKDCATPSCSHRLPQASRSLRRGAAGQALRTAAVALSVLMWAGSATVAQVSIGVSIGINAPGQYGRIDINNYPQLVVVNEQPVIYVLSAVAVHQRPIYLYVPPVQQASWGRYCGGYRACGQPVYFVQENWVRDEYCRRHDNREGRKAFRNKGRQDHGHGNRQREGHDRRND
jgi:hypothetical protein